MQKFLKIFFGVAVALFFSLALAQLNPFDITFPISELGDCGSVDECKEYCDEEVNYLTCSTWATANGLMDEESGGDDFREGPGGCMNESECDAYCQQKEHGNECLDFAVAEGFYTEEEAQSLREEMNKTGPGGCDNREECDTFCRNPENSATCLQFAVGEGVITQEEANFLIEREKMYREGGPSGPHPDGPMPGEPRPGGSDIDEEKARELLNDPNFVGPGGCTTMDECDTFCSVSKNDEECFNFALENGLIPPEQAEKFRKIMTEGGPGGCRGQVECDAFCSQPDHGEECFNFAKEHGLMSSEEMQMMEREMTIIRRLDQGAMEGPGGCSDRESCERFCSDPNHIEECARFSSEQGLVDKQEIERKTGEHKRMEMFMQEMRTTGSSGEGGYDDYMPPKGYDDYMPPEGYENFVPPTTDVYMVPPEDAGGFFVDKYESLGDYDSSVIPVDHYDSFSADGFVPVEINEFPQDEYMAPPTIDFTEDIEGSSVEPAPETLGSLILNSFISIFR